MELADAPARDAHKRVGVRKAHGGREVAAPGEPIARVVELARNDAKVERDARPLLNIGALRPSARSSVPLRDARPRLNSIGACIGACIRVKRRGAHTTTRGFDTAGRGWTMESSILETSSKGARSNKYATVQKVLESSPFHGCTAKISSPVLFEAWKVREAATKAVENATMSAMLKTTTRKTSFRVIFTCAPQDRTHSSAGAM